MEKKIPFSEIKICRYTYFDCPRCFVFDALWSVASAQPIALFASLIINVTSLTPGNAAPTWFQDPVSCIRPQLTHPSSSSWTGPTLTSWFRRRLPWAMSSLTWAGRSSGWSGRSWRGSKPDPNEMESSWAIGGRVRGWGGPWGQWGWRASWSCVTRSTSSRDLVSSSTLTRTRTTSTWS